MYASLMADNANPSYMEDLDFLRYNVTFGRNEYSSTTAYSQEQAEQDIDNMKAQGWTLYMNRRVI